jgi:hypothetical protein
MYIILLALSSACFGILVIKKAYNYYRSRYQLVEPIDIYDDDLLDIDKKNSISDLDIEKLKKSLDPMDAI